MNLTKRISVIEAKVVPKLSEAEARFCAEPSFRDFIAKQGLDINVLMQSGSVFGALPLEVVLQLRDRLMAMKKFRFGGEC